MKNFKFTIRGHEYEVDILNIEGNMAEIEVNGTMYQVEMDKEVKKKDTGPKLVRTNLPTPKDAGEIKKKTDGNIFKVEAPLPGNILNILVKPGDQVKKGQHLLIMEAMKMENEVNSEKDGVVKAVNVKNGDSVLQGDLLLEIEV